ncbi:MAG TPA: serine/threonine-protein kinase, partial [Kofleriaceae bacterium]
MDDDEAQTLQGSLARGPTASMTAVDPAPGTGKRYELGRELGRGGMGEVLIAQDTRIAREVAIKLMRPEQRDPESIARFFREAHIQGRLDHPSVVPVHDLGVDGNGNPYFVMKRLSGTTLFDVLAQRGKDPVVRAKWPRRQILARFVDVCLAIEFAHTRGIVHRDLKPANIMLGDFGEVYVLDWGLARVIDDDRSSGSITEPFFKYDVAQTAAGSVFGTPGYMPPEQIRDAAVGRHADVFSLGCILYEILTGETALPSGIPALEVTLGSACHRPSVRFPEVAIPELDDICAQATAAAPDDRPSARALADAVQSYLDGDRDLAQRRALATAHADRAREALASSGDEARAIAIREAGRALVLDAGNEGAQTVLASLLLETP